MGIRTIFRFSLEQWVRSLKKMVLMIGLFTFSFLLTGAVIYGNEYGQYNRKTCDRLLSQGLDNTMLMDVTDNITVTEETDTGDNGRYMLKMLCEDMERIADMEEVAFVASFYSLGYGELNGRAAQIISERQAQRLPLSEGLQFPEGNGIIRYGKVNIDGWGMFRLELEKGVPPGEMPQEENKVYLYLGAGYEDIPLGTVMSDGKNTVEVAGIFKKGQKWLIDNRLRFFSEENEDCYMDMDYWALKVIPRGNTAAAGLTWYFGVHSGADWETVSDKIQANMKFMKISGVGSLKASFDAREALYGDSMKMIKQVMVLTVLAVVLIQVCVQMAEILTSQRRYGILCANGMSVGALFGTVVVKNFLNLLLGGVIALVLGLCWVGRRDILMEMALAKTAAVGITAFVAAHILPMIVMAEMNPARLMRGI